MEFHCASIEELHRCAKQWFQLVEKNEATATIVTLSGDLGAGKTAFVKQVASILGITEQIQSPTFVLERRYAVPHGQQFDTLVHIDAYRLNGADELRRIRWDETRSNSGNIIFLEWPEQVQGAIPDDAITLTFQIIDEQTRVITTT